jgi:hypothetical protein
MNDLPVRFDVSLDSQTVTTIQVALEVYKTGVETMLAEFAEGTSAWHYWTGRHIEACHAIIVANQFSRPQNVRVPV